MSVKKPPPPLLVSADTVLQVLRKVTDVIVPFSIVYVTQLQHCLCCPTSACFASDVIAPTQAARGGAAATFASAATSMTSVDAVCDEESDWMARLQVEKKTLTYYVIIPDKCAQEENSCVVCKSIKDFSDMCQNSCGHIYCLPCLRSLSFVRLSFFPPQPTARF